MSVSLEKPTPWRSNYRLFWVGQALRSACLRSIQEAAARKPNPGLEEYRQKEPSMPRYASLSFDLLWTFLRLVENAGDAVRTAQELKINQPSMSKRLAYLQHPGHVLSKPWVVRTGKTWGLTREGRRVLPAVREVISRYQSLTDYLEGQQQLISYLYMAGEEFCGLGLLRAALQRWQQHRPPQCDFWASQLEQLEASGSAPSEPDHPAAKRSRRTTGPARSPQQHADQTAGDENPFEYQMPRPRLQGLWSGPALEQLALGNLHLVVGGWNASSWASDRVDLLQQETLGRDPWVWIASTLPTNLGTPAPLTMTRDMPRPQPATGRRGKSKATLPAPSTANAPNTPPRLQLVLPPNEESCRSYLDQHLRQWPVAQLADIVAEVPLSGMIPLLMQDSAVGIVPASVAWTTLAYLAVPLHFGPMPTDYFPPLEVRLAMRRSASSSLEQMLLKELARSLVELSAEWEEMIQRWLQDAQATPHADSDLQPESATASTATIPEDLTTPVLPADVTKTQPSEALASSARPTKKTRPRKPKR